MKVQEKTDIKKAGAVTPATQNNQHCGLYLKTVPLASLKFQIGELLLLLIAGDGQADGWRQLERLLRRFYEGGIL